MPFSPKKFIDSAVLHIRTTVGKEKAIIAVSGGVDSMAAAAIAHLAIPKQLTCVFVDTGLMRKNEAKTVSAAAEKVGISLKVIDASDTFFSSLAGITDPEEKRKAIGRLFIETFEKAAKKEGVSFLIQGTIAPDWIESGGGSRDKIKSHHNVGGLPEKMHLKLCEPMRDLYKHEVRMVARELDLPEEISERQPFPGPGLAVRIVGEITRKKAEIVRGACAIAEEEIEKAAKEGKIEKPWQYFAALLPTKTVGVRGDERAYQYIVVVRAVRSLDGMTVNFSHLPPELLQKISTRITNEIREVGRVLYDITNKPPATVEME
ncbi:GMP synthase [Candidatus Micrarchaeota archaeon CG11_big_fil_rev_8_21_14_0_20_47_5]|nr:MAG: GMP synthase [Candidatus Micrarchaeota archaeon CG1_02_47_40]PIN84125.1 MAG: GMP synthase [Candidatus Micrarchaeota archaeon CG11_big_fil_rev_8_21_14_0_20_47_5]